MENYKKISIIILVVSVSIAIGVIYVTKNHPEYIDIIKTKCYNFFKQTFNILYDFLIVDEPPRKRHRKRKSKKPKNKKENPQNIKNKKDIKQINKNVNTPNKKIDTKQTKSKTENVNKNNRNLAAINNQKINEKKVEFLQKIEYLENYDVIIVGAGLSGLSATYESYLNSNGKSKILLLEKKKNFGGNFAKETIGINILNSPLQNKQKISDSFEQFYNDTIKRGNGKNIPDLVKTLVNESVSIFNFLSEIKINLSNLGLFSGHSKSRTCLNDTKIGYYLTHALFNQIIKKPNITFSPNSNVIDLLYDNLSNTVKGVKFIVNDKEKIVKSKSVILTSGGFGHDFDNKDSLLKEFASKYINYPTSNEPQTTGNLIKIARKIGADLINMDKIQIYPTGFIDYSNSFSKNKILAPESLRRLGAILINKNGDRFCNELGTSDYITDKIIKNCPKIPNKNNLEQFESFMIINENIAVKNSDIKNYINKGLFKKYNNFKHFAIDNKIRPKTLIRTINNYNGLAKKKKTDPFGKNIYPEKFNVKQPIYVARISPVINYSLGGIKINKETEVLSKNKTINGLYAAGEVTGGVHGDNILDGNTLLECIVFGKKAGKNAIKYIQLKRN